MTPAIDIRKVYGIALFFVAASLTAIKFDIWLILAFPLVAAVLYVLLVKPKYIFYLLALTTPLSVHLVEEKVSTYALV